MSSQNGKKQFHVSLRNSMGKSSKKLSFQGKISCNIFGLKMDSVAVEADAKAFSALYEEEGDTGLIYLVVGEDKKEVPVLIDDVQKHPVTGKFLHAAFRRVNLTEKIEAEVPVELVGENSIPNTIVLLVKDSLEVEALPADLPEKFEIDVSQLTEIDQAITIGSLSYDRSKVEIVMAGDMSEETPVVILQEVKEEVEPVAEVAVDDVEVTGEKKEGEGAEEVAPKSDAKPAPKAAEKTE